MSLASIVGSGVGTFRRCLQLHGRNLVSSPNMLQPRMGVHSVPAMASDKMLNAVCRVADLESSQKFLEALGMRVLSERDVPEEKYRNVSFGYGPEQNGEHFSLELKYNYGVDSVNVGTGFGHFGIAVEDAYATVERVREAGFKVTREVSPVDGKRIGRVSLHARSIFEY